MQTVVLRMYIIWWNLVKLVYEYLSGTCRIYCRSELNWAQRPCRDAKEAHIAIGRVSGLLTIYIQATVDASWESSHQQASTTKISNLCPIQSFVNETFRLDGGFLKPNILPLCLSLLLEVYFFRSSQTLVSWSAATISFCFISMDPPWQAPA